MRRDEAATGRARPSGALLQLTRECNLACSHCSVSRAESRLAHVREELSTKGWVAVLDRLSEVGIQRVRFTGGEPFLREDLDILCHHAAKRGLSFSFVTNGLAIRPADMDWIAECGPESAWISVPGFPEQSFEKVTGAADGLRRVQRVVGDLLGRGVNVGLYYPLGNTTSAGVGQFVEYAVAAGVRAVRILQVLPHGRAASGRGLGQMEGREFLAALERIRVAAQGPATRVRVSMRCGQSQGFRDMGFLVPERRSCEIGLQNLWTVDSQGWVTPCCLLLNKGRLDLFDMTAAARPVEWYRWDRAAVLFRLGSGPDVTSCPAVSGEEASEDFVCPLTYAEVPSA